MPERPPTGRANPRDGGHDEIARLFDRHAAGLYRYALMVLADHGLAEDAVQQVFARLLSSKAGRPPDLPDHYVRRAVRNECYTLLRRQAVRRDERALKVYEGLTFREIAELTDTPPNTVASRYRYAIEKMRAVLETRARVK